MAFRTAHPPSHHHPSLTKHFSPSETASHLSDYLALASSNAHLHPDALLSMQGISFSATSGPSGGLALHHLRRIEAGLRGENLVRETREELEAQFGDEIAGLGPPEDLTEGLAERKGGSNKRARSLERVEGWEDGNGLAAAASGALQEGEGEWQDGEEFALSREETVGEVGARGTRQGDWEEMQGGDEKRMKVDKNARKAAKKERNKKAKAEELAKKKAAD